MAVRGPAPADAPFAHDDQPMRAVQREIPIRELFHRPSSLPKVRCVEWSNGQAGQSIDESRKLNGPPPVAAAKEPAVPLGDHQR